MTDVTDVTDVTNDGTAPISTVTPNPDKLEGDCDARAVKLLRVRRRVGAGSVDDPVRIAVSLWTESGELIHEIDPARQPNEREELLEAGFREVLGILESMCSGNDDPAAVTLLKRCRKLAGLLS